MWEKLKMDFIERFLNFETAKGFYLVPAGGVIIYVSLYYQQYLFTAVGVLFGWYCVSEGLRKIAVNRFAQARAAKEISVKRQELEGGSVPETGVFVTK